MTWNLFIDDERNPADVIWGSYSDQIAYRSNEWTIARNWSEVRKLVLEYGIPKQISFDHDLGENEETGYYIARRLVDFDLDGVRQFPADFKYMVHSKNPIGSKNIRGLLDGFLNQKCL